MQVKSALDLGACGLEEASGDAGKSHPVGKHKNPSAFGSSTQCHQKAMNSWKQASALQLLEMRARGWQEAQH